MPGIGPAGAAIASAIGTFLTSTSTVYVVARLVTAVAVSTLLARKAAAYDPGMQARAITVRGTVEPQLKVYGEALVSGPIAWNDVSGEEGRYLWSVVCLAGHEVEAITDIWLDDKVITNATINGGAAAGGGVDSGYFGPQDGKDVAQIFKYYGTSSQTSDASLTAEFTGWTTAHRLRGIAYIVCRWNLWNRSEKVWNNSDPTNVRALVKGARVYDPRLDSTNGGTGAHRYNDPATWTWSDNPALCAADYLIDTKFGLGIAPTRIDWPAVISAADFCDVTVSVPGGTEKRYTCNGTVSGTSTHRDNLQSILSAMNGEITVSAGQWTIRAGQYVAPSKTYTADDVIAPLGIQASAERSERINTLSAQFIDKDDRYKVVESPPVFTTTLRNRDNGQVLEDELALPMTDSFYMAQRIQWVALHVAAQEKRASTKMNLKAAATAIGDRINLSIAELSWSPKVFRMLNWQLVDDGGSELGVAVELREDSASAYTDPDVADYTTRSAAGVITFGDPGLAAPSGLTATAVPGGIQWEWNNPAEFSTYDDIVFYASATSAWAGAAEVWRGRADQFLQPLDPGVTRFGWVRAIKANEESARDPDSDTSTVSATAGALGSGATVGDDLVDLEGNVVYGDVLTNFDEATALGLNPAFSKWTTASSPPDNWSGWTTATGRSRETTIKRTGPYSVKFNVTTTNVGLFKTISNISIPFDAVVVGSLDVYIETYTSGGAPGILVDLYDTTATRGFRREAPADISKTGQWQTVYFKVSSKDYTILTGGGGGSPTLINRLTVYLMGSYSGMDAGPGGDSGGSFLGTVYFDNLRLAILDPNLENERATWAQIKANGGDAPEDNATVGAVAGSNLVAQYVAGTTVDVVSESTTKAHTGTLTSWQRKNRFNIAGEGTMRFTSEILVNSAIDGGDTQGAQVRVLQGAVVLWTGSGQLKLASQIPAWQLQTQTITLDNPDDPVDVEIRNGDNKAVSIRNVALQVEYYGNGESVGTP